MTRKKKNIKYDIIQFLHDRYVGDDPERLAMLEEERANAEVARMIYGLRTSTKISQRKLARLVGTTASVICRMEDADYEGHSLSMLRRIARALNKHVEIRFVPVRKKPKRS